MRGESNQSVHSHRGAILCFLWIIAAVCAGRVVLVSVLRAAPAPVREGVDPNVAPWWDLTLLPDVGPTTAKAIVDLRNKTTPPAYHAAIDLTRVKGIGPRTIQHFGPYLRFDQETSSTSAARPPVAATDQ
jgi:DNA uptake protein ComE-like DNA-binding protein